MNIDRMELDTVTQEQQRLLGGKGFKYFGMLNAGIEADSREGNDGVKPWVSPPDGHVPFDEPGTVAVGVVGTTSTVVTFTVPDGYDGVIKRLSVNYVGGGFVSGSGDLIWRLLADNKPIRNYENINTELGTLQIPRPVDSIRIFSGQVVTFQVNHVANGALGSDSVGTLAGYFYPRKGE